MGTSKCSRCGAPLGPTAAGQVCPACLIKVALDEPDVTPATPALSFPVSSHAIPRPQRIGPYTILEQLGEGGMGVVYLAEQAAPIRRRVALKLIKLGMDTHQVVARFEAERQALALMDHPNIASVFDAGATEDGRPFFVMEYVPGVPITEFCDRQQLTTRARLELFQHVCAAIQHAHQKGVIHRDLKPSNVLVIDQDGQPTPKVIDFGIAKATGQHLTEKTLFTEQGLLVGTPEYMSPEQADTGGGPVDTRTDIYSLGILLYELLVGNLPFTPTELRRAGYAEIQRIIREREPIKPSSKLHSLGLIADDIAVRRRTSTSSLARELRGDLDWITLRAIEKDPNQRYPSASELAADIGRHLHYEPVLAGPPGARYRLKKFVRKHRGAVAVCLALAILLSAGLAVSTALYVRAQRSRQEADRQRAAADRERTAAQTAQREADRQRDAAQTERAVAETERATAEIERTVAVVQRDEALYQSYRNALLAADQNLLAREFDEARRRLEATDVRFRGWEWRYLSRAADSSLLATAAFTREVRDVRFSSSGDAIFARGYGDSPIFFGGVGSVILRGPVQTGGKSTVTKVSLGRSMTTARLPVGERVIAISPDGSRVLTTTWDMNDFFIECQVRDPQPGVVCQPGRVSNDWQFTRPTLLRQDRDRLVVRETSTSQTIATLSQPSVGVWTTNRAASSHYVVARDGAGGSTSVWHHGSSQPIARLSGQYPEVLGATFNGDGTRLASWSWDNVIHVWDLSTQSTIATLRGHSDGIRSVQFDPTAARVVSTSYDGTARLWSVADGSQLQILQITAPSTAAFSRNGERMAVGTDSGLIHIIETASGRGITSLKVQTSSVTSLVLSPDSSRIAVSAAGDETIRLWSVPDAVELAALVGHDKPVTSIAFSPDGKALASGARDGTVRLWTAQPAISSLPGPAALAGRGTPRITAVGLTASNGELVSTSEDGTIRVWNMATGTLRRTLDLKKEMPFLGDGSAAMSIRASRLAFLFGPDGPPIGSKILDVSSGASLMTVLPDKSDRRRVPRFAISPDGIRLAMAWRTPTGGMIAVWNVPSGRRIGAWKIDGFVQAMACSDHRVAVVIPSRQSSNPESVRGRMVIFDVGSNIPIAGVEVSRASNVPVAAIESALADATLVKPVFSPDGSQVAFADGPKVMLWNLDSRAKAVELGKHDGNVGILSMSPDGSRLATAGADSTLRIWDTARRELLLTIRTIPLASALSFSADGERLVVGSTRGIQILDGSQRRVTRVR